MIQILLYDIPLWPVEAQCGACVGVDLDKADVIDPGLFQAERLAPSAGTQLQGDKVTSSPRSPTVELGDPWVLGLNP